MSERLEGRNGEIWRKYCRGRSMPALAEEYGISNQRVSQIIREVRDSIPQEERADLIKEEIDLFRALRDDILSVVYDAPMAPVTAGKDGDIVRDPETGQVVRDPSAKLAALARMESLSARMHKLLGLEASQKVDLTMLGEEAAAQRAAAEAASYVHGGTEE